MLVFYHIVSCLSNVFPPEDSTVILNDHLTWVVEQGVSYPLKVCEKEALTDPLHYLLTSGGVTAKLVR